MGVVGPNLFDARPPMDAYVTIFSLLNRAGVWFKFVDDGMLLRGADLGAYKAVFVPLASYEPRRRRREVARLRTQRRHAGGARPRSVHARPGRHESPGPARIPAGP